MASIRELFDKVCDLPAEARLPELRKLGADKAQIERVQALLGADATLPSHVQPKLAQLASHLLDTELKIGDRLDVWRLVRELGHGGMGSVFLAERADGHFSQLAAIKLIRGQADDQTVKRFARERQLLASLQHPHIARLIDGGATPQGQPYLVMEYVDGEPIVEWCRKNKIPLNQRLSLFRRICETVQFAHNRLVVHCDLKPSNVLVRTDGVPVLLDFGIARVTEDSSAESPTLPVMVGQQLRASGLTSHTLMTPRYASPEQLRGEVPGIASDIFSLGLMLYELTTDTAPPRDRTLALPRPSKAGARTPWHKRLAGDIDAIVARACAADPAERYASAAELGQEIVRMAQHRPVRAREAQRMYLAARFLRRRWLSLAAVMLIVLLTSVFTVRTKQAEQRALREAAVAQQATEFMASVFAGADTDQNKQQIAQLTALDLLAIGRERIETELMDTPAVRARLLDAIGNAYRHQQDNITAVPMLAEAAELYLSPEVDDKRSAARLVSAQVNAMANGEFPGREIEAVAERSVRMAHEVAEPGSQMIANAKMTLSLAYNRNGRFDEALQAAEESFEINRRHRNLPNNRYMPALHNLALILTSLGETQLAHDYADEVISLNLPESTGIAANYRAKALVLIADGEYQEALDLFRHSLGITRKHFGDASRYGIFYRGFIVSCLNYLGRHDEAFEVLDTALKHQTEFGLETREAIVLYHEQALGDLLSGRTTAALDRAEMVWRMREQAYGEDPRPVYSRMVWIRAALQANDASEDVRDAIDSGIAFWDSRNQAHHPYGLALRLLRAHWLLANGKQPAARGVLAEIGAHQHRLFAHDRLYFKVLQAWSAHAAGDASAVALSRDAFEAHRMMLGDEHPRTAITALRTIRTLTDADEPIEPALADTDWQHILRRTLPADSDFLRAIPDA